MSLKKTESGAELLARLHARPDPKYIDPFIFGDTSASSSCRGVVEIFGPEGVGKTELALNCAAKTCLPVESKGLKLHGLGAKVIIVDTDFKFSILRLAVILEKQIKHATSMKKNNANVHIENKRKSCGFSSKQSEKQGDIKECKELTITTNSLKDEEGSPADSFDYLNLTNSDLEDIVKEGLKNIQVLKVKTSQQLLASLLSLESVVAEDPSYTLLIIDSISSFYWTDRANDFENRSGKKMAFISDALARLVDNFGLTCIAISSSFFISGKSTQFPESAKNSWMNSEYLGKSWSSTRRKRIVLSKKEILEDGEHSTSNREKQKQYHCDNFVHAFCNLTKTRKEYVFDDDYMKDL